MMLLPTNPRSPLFALGVSAGFVLLFTLGFLTWQSPPRMTLQGGHEHNGLASSIAGSQSEPAITDIIPLLFKSLKIDPAEPQFTFVDESKNLTKLALPPKPRYKKPLGKDILILDLETRTLPSAADFEKGEFHWKKLNHVAGGVFNHYAYALTHGYDYKFVKAAEFEDRHATWIKPSAFANHINDYKFIVFLDADAAFRHMHLPIEWLLNYWEIKPQHSITMALDPWDPATPQFNSDRNNRTYTNTGFVVVQNNADTQGILKAWHECPDDVRYPGCSEWKGPKFHEQSAFGEYIRYDYEDHIKELQCADANGYPGVKQSNCEGRFIRHYWFDKFRVKDDFSNNIMQAITLPLQRIFTDNSQGVVEEQKENVIV